MWDIAGYLGHADTRTAERTYAHHHPDYQDRPARALAEALAGIGAAEAPALRKLAARDPRQDQGAPGGTSPETSSVRCEW